MFYFQNPAKIFFFFVCVRLSCSLFVLDMYVSSWSLLVLDTLKYFMPLFVDLLFHFAQDNENPRFMACD